MRQQHRLHLGAGDVVAGRNDHVVVARDEMKISFLVLAKCIASQVPAVLHVFTLTDVGEIAATGRAPHREPPNRSARNFIEILVDDLGFVTWHGSSGDARSSVMKTVCDE